MEKFPTEEDTLSRGSRVKTLSGSGTLGMRHKG